MAPHKIQVAVLDADIPCLSVFKARGLYSSQFRVLLQAAAERLNQRVDSHHQNGPLAVHVTAFDAVGRSLPPLDCLRAHPRSPTETHAGGPMGFIDAILITGSAASAYDKDPWIRDLQSFIQTVHTDYPLVKIFGSCFGHQIVAQALLSNNAPEISAPNASTFHVEHAQTGFEMGIQQITLDPSFTASFPPLARASSQNPFRIQLIHGDMVVPARNSKISLPAPWMNIGSSAQCPIQGLYSPGRVLTYQGHFEFDVFVNAELCQEFGRRANWSPQQVASYLEQINRARVPGKEDDDDDSKAAAEAVVLFFAGEDRDKNDEGLDDEGLVHHGLITPPLGEHIAH